MTWLDLLGAAFVLSFTVIAIVAAIMRRRK